VALLLIYQPACGKADKSALYGEERRAKPINRRRATINRPSMGKREEKENSYAFVFI
jgi:hypothetical protein